MTMTVDEKKTLIAYRMQKSDCAMTEAHDNARLGHWSLVANRLYYAVFHMASALMLEKGIRTKSHAGLICVLGREFVTYGLLSKEDARLASRLLNMRQTGDYDDMFDWEEEDVAPLFPKTEELLSKLRGLIAGVS
ncbi:MAG: HEPN domain-containing protein [Bacteroides sp.]|nr:HEPN domain-containing protein [Bacteroides sp.]